jgi:hypothetical protein
MPGSFLRIRTREMAGRRLVGTLVRQRDDGGFLARVPVE